MTRKGRRAAKHAAGIGKGRATPKRPPKGMSRSYLSAVQAQQRRTAGGRLRVALEVARDLGRQERTAIEKLARDAGAIDLSHLTRKAQDR